MPKLDPNRPFIPVRIAVLTVSDTRSHKDDKSGDTLAAMIHAAGHEVTARGLVKDDVEAIRAQVRAWIADKSIDVIISTGGTGFTGRDVTPEAIRPLFEKEVDGFSTVFHMISFDKVGTSTIQSRACRDAWNGILVHQLDNRHRPCNFVEIMPRLEEHRRSA